MLKNVDKSKILLMKAYLKLSKKITPSNLERIKNNLKESNN